MKGSGTPTAVGPSYGIEKFADEFAGRLVREGPPNAHLQKGFASDALGDAVSVPNAGPARTSMSGVAAIDHKSLTDSE